MIDAECNRRRARLKSRHGYVMGTPGVGPLGCELGDVTNQLVRVTSKVIRVRVRVRVRVCVLYMFTNVHACMNVLYVCICMHVYMCSVCVCVCACVCVCVCMHVCVHVPLKIITMYYIYSMHGMFILL